MGLLLGAPFCDGMLGAVAEALSARLIALEDKSKEATHVDAADKRGGDSLQDPTVKRPRKDDEDIFIVKPNPAMFPAIREGVQVPRVELPSLSAFQTIMEEGEVRCCCLSPNSSP